MDDVTICDMEIKTNDVTKLELNYTFTLGHIDLVFMKNKLIKLSDNAYPSDIIGEICSFLCMDEYLYTFKFAHSYNCTVVQNHFGSQFVHQNEYALTCLNDPKVYSTAHPWSEDQFRALLLSMMCCGYKIIKKSNVLTQIGLNKVQRHYHDRPLCQNMELFTRKVHKKSNGENIFHKILKDGLTLSAINPKLQGLEEAIGGGKITKKEKRMSPFRSMFACFMPMY